MRDWLLGAKVHKLSKKGKQNNKFFHDNTQNRQNRQETALAIARALKDNGVTLEVIARSLGLTNEQTKELAEP